MYFTCFYSVLFIGVVSSFPWENAYHVPQRVVMMSGYYGTPVFGRTNQYVPQGSISAFVNKDTIATNTFAGGALDLPRGEIPVDEHTGAESYTEKTEIQEFPGHDIDEETPEITPVQKPQHVGFEETEGSFASETSEHGSDAPVTRTPKRIPRKKKVQKPIVPQEDEEDNEEDEVPRRRTYVPSNNVFFPITITGGARSRARNGGGQEEDEFYSPGAATAIANSYSTGKGGIATSHATSFGDPYFASMLYRNGFFNHNKAKKGQIEA